MPLFRRFGRPGLLGSVARTAVVAGTATMTARAVGRDAEEPQSPPGADGQAGEPPCPAAPPESVTWQLATLASLNRAGAISDDEFARAKKRVLE